MKKSSNFAFRHILKTSSSLYTFWFILSTAVLFSQSGWGPDVRLTYFWGYSYDPRAACCGDTVHLVWWEHYGVSGETREEVFYKRSTDAGETWGPDVLLSVEDDKTSVLPWVAVNQNYLHVVWQQQDVGICYRKSTNGGNLWLPIDTLPGGSGNPSVCAIGTNVYAVAYRTDGRIVFYKSTDSGNTWLPSQVLTFILSNRPRISSVCSNQDLLVLTCEDKPYTVEIYFIKSKDGGNTWIDSQFVSQNDSIGSQNPAMDADDSSNIHITWYDYKYSPYAWTGDIFYRASRDSGNSWEPIDSLTVIHRAVASDILAEGTNLHLVWEDDRNDFGNNFEIYYRMSSDLGQTWGSEVRLTDALNWSCGPSLACDGQFLHLFWFDLRDDPSNIVGEIYYKRRILTGIQETTPGKYWSSSLSLDCPTILGRNRWIQYNLGNMKEGEVKIMDITGMVREAFPVHGIAGEFVLDFNKEVCDGVYFIVLRAGKEYTTKKVLVVR